MAWLRDVSVCRSGGAYLAAAIWGHGCQRFETGLRGCGRGSLFSFTSAPFCRRTLRTGSQSGTLAEIMRGVQPLPSWFAAKVSPKFPFLPKALGCEKMGS